MISSLRVRIIEPLTFGGYLVLLVIGFQLDSREGWIGTLAGVALLAFIAWILSFRSWRLILDTPTSRVG